MIHRTCNVCLATGEPEIPVNFLHYVYSAEIVDIARNDASSRGSNMNLGGLVKLSYSKSQEPCPEARTSSLKVTCRGNSNSIVAFHRVIKFLHMAITFSF